ncbi:MAG: GAF domain-containing protein [Chloroflexota bacterium]
MINPAPGLQPTLERGAPRRYPASRRPDNYPTAARRISLGRRIAVLLGLMVLFVLAPSGIGLWYATYTGQAVGSMRSGAEQAIQVSDVELSWFSLVAVLQTMPEELSTSGQMALDSRLGDLQASLQALAAAPIGSTSERAAANQEIVDQLEQISQDTRRLAGEVYDLALQGEVGQAQLRRQEGLNSLQTRLTRLLSQLNANIQADLAERAAQVERLRRLAGIYATLVSLLAVTVAGYIVWMARRTVIQPLQRLTRDVESIKAGQQTGGNITPIVPLERNDEMGDLSRALALMTTWLRESYELLEQRVAQRTQELERRRSEIQVSAQVARDIASTANLESLLKTGVDLIRDRFGFYHAGIFLNDGRGEYAVLRAATGEAGRELLARSHRLRIGQTGLVGFAAQSGEPRIALDTGRDATHFRNPLLPETRSEAALPLRSGGRVIGVLDVQSTAPNAFDEESLEVLQILADQLATAIQNARLLQEVQQNLYELQTAYGQIDRQAWQRFTAASPLVGYEADGVGLQPLTAGSAPPAGEAQPYSVPLRVRGQTIGALDVWARDEQLSEAERSLLESVSDRLGQVLESARLFEEAQMRAARQELINRLTAGIARSLDADGVLRSAALSLAEIPAVLEAAVMLASQEEDGHGHRA